ncbi:hypothetical protein T265_01513 [Opisthorchis viverrini]|uniref:Protein kinase domain-containing protein n=2 Tax=Opisthorchis viverrini TaxID=6198 RepID=A0A075AIY8_OPIVI|nr:hypothetical protein T265_01513 [Opisthorchis viverrini]KER32459.1 hypothetical protein T265_01513 [Opisthorchis viverrini]
MILLDNDRETDLASVLAFFWPHFLMTVPMGCERLIRVMLAKVPAKRPSTRELFQHPWFTDSSSQNPAQFSGSAATCVSSSSSAIPIPNHGVSDRWTRSSSPHSVRRLDINVNPQNSPKRKALVEPDSDLAADVEGDQLKYLLYAISFLFFVLLISPPPGCERLIRVMLAKVPAKRPSTRELFQHPWFTDSSSQNPAQFSGSAATCVSSSSSAIPIPNHGVSDRWTRSSSPHSVRRLDINVNPQNSPKRKALVEPDSDLAADVEKGKLNEFIILIMESYGMKRSQILESLSRRAYDHLMATYLLLGEKVRRHRYSLQLPLRSDHHLVTCSVPVKMKPTSSSPPGPVRGLVAKQSRVDSAVDIKSIISESDSNATSSFSIPVSDTESNVLCHLSSTLWGDAPASYERFSFDDQSGMGQPRQGQLTVPTSQQPPSYVCDIQLGKSFEDSLIASFEPNQRVTFNDQDQTSRPWLIGGNYALDDKGPANEPPRRTLVRRKYGVFDPPAHLEQLTQSLLAERYNTDSTPPADLDSNDDG